MSDGISSAKVHGVSIPLLVMSLDLGSGKQDSLRIYPESSPQALAQQIVQKHHLKKSMSHQLETIIKRKKAAASRFISSHGNMSSILSVTRPSATEPSPPRPEKKPNSPNRSLPSNYGEWMYQRALSHKSRLRYDQLRTSLHQRTKQTASKALHRMRSSEATESLLRRAELTQSKLNARRSEAVDREMTECTFRPSVNDRSEKLDRSSSLSFSGSQRYLKLYGDAYDKELRQLDRQEAALKTEFSFRPSVVSSRKSPESQTAMVNRLLNSKKNFCEVISKLKSELDDSLSRSCSATGFKPMTGRGPIWGRNVRKGEVHEYLYSQRNKHKAVVSRLRHEVAEQRSPGRLSIPKSEELVADSRKRFLRTLFLQLDQNRDGSLDFDSLTLDEMDNRSMLILSPIYARLQETGGKMKFEDFEKEMDELLAYISNEEKTYLMKAVSSLGREEPLETETRLSFLSKTSEELATRRMEQLGSDVYTRRVAEVNQSAERLKALREEKVKEELKHCTFRPAINSYRKKI